MWEPICALGSTTLLPCITGGTAITPPVKEPTYEHTTQGARPFTVYAELDCSAPGFWDDAESEALTALTQSEHYQIERTLWTGIAGEMSNIIYPNLNTVGPVMDAEILLQPAGTFISGAVPLDIVEGLGTLENNLAACYNGVGVIHVPAILLPAMCAQGLVYEKNGKLYTKLGNLVAAGAGYNWSEGPNGANAPAGTGWLMATGPVFHILGQARVIDKRSSLDRGVNTLKMIAERTVLIGYNCCLTGVLVTLGGEPAGIVSSST